MKYPEAIKLMTDTLWWMKSKQDLEGVLWDILTPNEAIAVWERIEIFKQLLKWTSQREIAEYLGVSITTVTRWNRVLKHESPTIDKYLK